MFEILTRFVEEEMLPVCKKNQSEMYWDEAVKNEMFDLYTWWKRHLVKKKNVFRRYDQLKKRHSKSVSKNGYLTVDYSCPEKEKEINFLRNR